MVKNEQNGFTARKQNKGFTVHLGDTYIGHLVINEDRVKPETVEAMQKPEIMAKILADTQCELRKFVPEDEREKRDTSAVDAIIASSDDEPSTGTEG